MRKRTPSTRFVAPMYTIVQREIRLIIMIDYYITNDHENKIKQTVIKASVGITIITFSKFKYDFNLIKHIIFIYFEP